MNGASYFQTHSKEKKKNISKGKAESIGHGVNRSICNDIHMRARAYEVDRLMKYMGGGLAKKERERGRANKASLGQIGINRRVPACVREGIAHSNFICRIEYRGEKLLAHALLYDTYTHCLIQMKGRNNYPRRGELERILDYSSTGQGELTFSLSLSLDDVYTSGSWHSRQNLC